MALLLSALLLLGGPAGSAAQQTCPTTDFMSVTDIVATCCENVDGNCAASFPTTCAHTCARLVVPWLDQCESMLAAVPDEFFDGFRVNNFTTFGDSCRQTLVLYEHGVAGHSCTDGGSSVDPALQTRVDAVNSACCEQRGRNVCTNGVPQTCDAECAAEFLPFWHLCLDQRRGAIGGDMHVFTVLYTACTDGLPQEESMLLYRDVTAMDDSPECVLDSSLLLSRSVAKRRQVRPTCETDAFPVCENFIASGLKACESDYCELCPEAHTCDHTCGLPCAGGTPDSSGNHRFLGELGGFSGSVSSLSRTCPLEELGSRLADIDAACCNGEDACAGGVPASCPYACGRVWTTFHADCWDLLSNFRFVDEDQLPTYEGFSGTCLDIDPVGMALALYDATCGVCGDGVVGESEQCDAGEANADAEGAVCRTNCMLPRCGDGVVDGGEECDDGLGNSDEEDEGATCHADCTAVNRCDVSVQFTTLDGAGSTGPTSTDGYAGTDLDGQVTLDSGVQVWTVPSTGEYTITAAGARGGNHLVGQEDGSPGVAGGRGAAMSGVFDLTEGQRLKILVGQQGVDRGDAGDYGAGGGGGTFVVYEDNVPLVVAGGGAGAQDRGQPGNVEVLNAVTTSDGVSGECGSAGGSDGSGGDADHAGGGGGLSTDGASASTPGGQAFANGGVGGAQSGDGNSDHAGGFGGGGAPWDGGGAGGGYSGGGSCNAASGGGGSINYGQAQSNEAGTNAGDGYVSIRC
eukprot:SAG31_NODE_682_length_12841_cov_13.637655_2_plen_744_part_00